MVQAGFHDQSAEHRQRHRTEQDDKRIAEAIELRGQHEKDQHDGEHAHTRRSARRRSRRAAGQQHFLEVGRAVVCVAAGIEEVR